MRRFYSVDLRDLWRRDEHGPLLTLRQLWVYVRCLPHDSALAIDDNGGVMPLTIGDSILLEQWELEANRGRGKGKPRVRHPLRERQQSKQLERKAKQKRSTFERAKARRQQQLRRTDVGTD